MNLKLPWRKKGEKSVPHNIYEYKYSDNAEGVKFGTIITTWKGSVMKLIYRDFIVYVLTYFLISIIYRHILVAYEFQTAREKFELVCIYVARFQSVLPIAFITGFYVSTVVTRWWGTFMALPFPDKLALKLTAIVAGNTAFKRNLRRTIMRYVNVSTLLAYRLIARQVKQRFPDNESLISSKLLLPHEAERLKRVDERTPHESTWVPLLWAMKLLQKANSSTKANEKLNIPPPILSNLISSFQYIEDSNRKLLNYGWVEMPLAYTQVVTTAVHAYFFSALFGRQHLIPHQQSSQLFEHTAIEFSSSDPFKSHTPDFIIPVFTFIEFICYMGWIKVAASLLNPFGEDDYDFSMNYLIDRNLQVSYLIVDEADTELEMVTDPFLEAGISIPEELPYEPNNALGKLIKDEITNKHTEKSEITLSMSEA